MAAWIGKLHRPWQAQEPRAIYYDVLTTLGNFFRTFAEILPKVAVYVKANPLIMTANDRESRICFVYVAFVRTCPLRTPSIIGLEH